MHEVGDSAGLAQAIRHYATDESDRLEQGRCARELFEKRFGKERGLQAHRRLIESLGGPVE